jgi:ribonuclease-3
MERAPTYKVLHEEGPDHAKNFKVGVFLDKELVATGEGTSKQEAQTDAAEMAIKAKKWKGPKINIIKRSPEDPL